MNIDSILKRAQEFAEKNSIELNPNVDVVNTVLHGLIRKQTKHGKLYCPCRLQNIKENICPCEACVEDVRARGECHCRLFVKKI